MAIVRNIQTNVLYRYLGNDRYKNLCTGVEGEIKPLLAEKIFKINLAATQIISEYPIIETLIEKLKLKLDVSGLSG